MSAGGERRQVALHVDDDAGARASGRRCRAPRRCGRSRRHGRRGSSPRGRRPSRPRPRSAPNRSRPRPGRAGPPRARRSTCTIIGSPAMSASGLPGSRVEAMRAGMRMRTSRIGHRAEAGEPSQQMDREFGRLYGLPETRQTGYLCAAVASPVRRPSGPASDPSAEPWTRWIPSRLNKILGAVLGTCLVVLALNIAAGAIFTPAQAGQARLRDRGPGQARPRRAGEAGRARAADRSAARQCRRGQGREFGQEMRGLPHLQQGRREPGRSQSLGRRRPREGVRGGLQLFGRLQGA